MAVHPPLRGTSRQGGDQAGEAVATQSTYITCNSHCIFNPWFTFCPGSNWGGVGVLLWDASTWDMEQTGFEPPTVWFLHSMRHHRPNGLLNFW